MIKDIPQELLSLAGEYVTEANAKEVEKLKSEKAEIVSLMSELNKKGKLDKNDPLHTELAKVESKLKKMGVKEGVELSEEGKGDKEEYKKVFNAAMEKFGVSSPDEFESDEKKKEFFDYVDSKFKSDGEEKGMDEESIKEAHQISTPHHASPEPNSAVGFRRLPEQVKTAEIVNDSSKYGLSYRVLLTFPNSRPTMLPEAGKPGVASMAELQAYINMNCPECMPKVAEAIAIYLDTPNKRAEHSEGSDLGANDVVTVAHGVHK